ncbi:hypothetical protein C2G38_2035523 [Gigaspora rosea]|uniref:Uncharacterized protein n=1 Tax=Gigaspora rosea TaxID=44941 RepID=A0A397VCB0_9GLOM|nr:hypothetical protein C2G38_2035523 [Gigaspora rosea]
MEPIDKETKNLLTEKRRRKTSEEFTEPTNKERKNLPSKNDKITPKNDKEKLPKDLQNPSTKGQKTYQLKNEKLPNGKRRRTTEGLTEPTNKERKNQNYSLKYYRKT